MVKDEHKESEFQEEGFAKEKPGPGKSGKKKARNDPSAKEHQGPPTAFYLHALLLFGGRLLNMVLNAYNSLFDLTQKDRTKIYRNLSTHYVNKGLYDKALEHLEEWVRLEPSNPDAHYQMGIALATSGNSERSINAFNTVLNLNPKHKGAIYRKSSLHLKTKNFKEAVQGFETLVKMTPDNPKVYYLLGIAHEHLDKIDKAIEVIGKAAELDPNEIKYQQHLGLLNARKDDHKTAAKYFTKVMELEREQEEDEL
jgi:tetratricopeptide (TPR) repeat protein